MLTAPTDRLMPGDSSDSVSGDADAGPPPPPQLAPPPPDDGEGDAGSDRDHPSSPNERRRERLEQNRISARESRKRRKNMSESLRICVGLPRTLL